MTDSVPGRPAHPSRPTGYRRKPRVHYGRIIALGVAVALTVTAVTLKLASGEPATEPPTDALALAQADEPSDEQSASRPTEATASATPAPKKQKKSTKRTLAGLDLTTRSPDEAASLWVVVNKPRPLDPVDHTPELATAVGVQVDKRAAEPLADLVAAAAKAQNPIRVVSAYRSYDRQVGVYNNKVASVGRDQADRVSARPGHSEHQTGLAVDVADTSGSCVLLPCFGQTRAGTWVAENAADFGFLVRYTEQNQQITGYAPEPWHLRFVGKDLAQAMKKADIGSLEEVFDVAGGDYVD